MGAAWVPEWLSGEVAADLTRGLAVTVGLTVLTSVLSLIIGLMAAAARSSRRRRIRYPAAAYNEVFRNVPALIQIIFWAFAVPNLFPTERRPGIFFDNPVVDLVAGLTGLPLPYYAVAAGLGLTLNTSAHLAEIIRGGIRAVPVDQVETVQLLGANRRDRFRTVVLPSAVRTSFPAVSTRLIHNMKNTALASFVAVPEFFGEIQASITKSFRATEFLLLAAAVYLLLSAVMTVGLGQLDRRLHRWRATPAEAGS